MRTSKVENERRVQALKGFFEKNPELTVKAALDQFAAGTVTGQPEKRMNLKAVYAIRTQVRKEIDESLIGTPEGQTAFPLEAEGCEGCPAEGAVECQCTNNGECEVPF